MLCLGDCNKFQLSWFYGQVGYDVFRLMKTQRMLYGFVSVVQDTADCVTGLWDLAALHLHQTDSTATFFHEWPQGVVRHTRLFVCVLTLLLMFFCLNRLLDCSTCFFCPEPPSSQVFYNNFEISHASVWTSSKFTAWFQAVQAARGIYTTRWGDAPIRTLAVSMFVDPKRVHRFSDIGYTHAPMFTQEASALPTLGLHVSAAAFCTHIHYWHLVSNDSARSQNACKPLLPSESLKMYQPSRELNRRPQLLSEQMVASCNQPLLTEAVAAKCALPVVTQQMQRAELPGGITLELEAALDLQGLLGVRQHGLMGCDVATSIPLESANGTNPRILWLLGDTLWGKYNKDSCARETKGLLPRNMFAVTTKSSSSKDSSDDTCFYHGQNEAMLPSSLLAPPGHTAMEMMQQHWWWLFSGLVVDGKLYLLGADFWLAPHTM